MVAFVPAHVTQFVRGRSRCCAVEWQPACLVFSTHRAETMCTAGTIVAGWACQVPCKSLAVRLIKEDAVGVSCRLLWLWLWLWLWNGACKAEPTVTTPATPAQTGCSSQQNNRTNCFSQTHTSFHHQQACRPYWACWQAQLQVSKYGR